ncbi:hypothetical protein [Hoyosella subflava]|uniref:PknH-like extracellular domain-containing protein n=1 Tax=Hoyosella subflava (strain DSM 45089 / JCM 17490 / NBRC 109087 / DQS3-9A1) TaxID=443218 RepID=F6EKR3_HOYSD|nr:hypothetical protein [Hoyosella subflava]AEF40199.1 hypothetical protein AS9A_1750 [Hoyosella subflava DQS3-9A1]
MSSIPRFTRSGLRFVSAAAGVTLIVSVVSLTAGAGAAAQPNPSNNGEGTVGTSVEVPLNTDRIQFVQLDDEHPAAPELWALMLPVSAFPDPYVMSDRSGPAAQRVLASLAGVPRGTLLTPQNCMVGEPAESVIVRTATAYDGGSSLSFTLSKTDEPLSAVEDLLAECRFAKAVDPSGSVTDISTKLLPPPPVNGDDALAYSRTVSRADVGTSSTQLILAAQVEDYRIMAIGAQFADGDPDSTLLHVLFMNAVERVRSGVTG